MATYKEIIYMCLDELKINSDDSYFEEEHVLFLMDKFRAFLLKQRYSDVKKQMATGNNQAIELPLVEVPAISGEVCEGGSYLKSSSKIPNLMQISKPVVYPVDYYQGEIAYVSRDRMKYVGYNKYLQNIIYTSLGPDNYLYFKSPNPQFLYLEKVRMNGVFEDTQKANELKPAEDGDPTDIMDMDFPLEHALIPPLVELIVRELLPPTYRPQDEQNNASDDLSGLTVKE